MVRMYFTGLVLNSQTFYRPLITFVVFAIKRTRIAHAIFTALLDMAVCRGPAIAQHPTSPRAHPMGFHAAHPVVSNKNIRFSVFSDELDQPEA
jgi:hypothetical protein